MTPIAPTDVACPFCGAPVGEPCRGTNSGRLMQVAHHSRIWESERKIADNRPRGR